ncbi:MAG TPA: tyrosine-type recombinase/integrase [Bacteroidia bacterium]|nr:tyrosine-type recombinase/integrase [Bacteroidia bacterium]
METIEIATLDFLSHCRYEKNLSSKTLKSYTIDLRQLSEFLTSHNYSRKTIDIDKNILREYLQSISYSKPKTIKRKMATVKALFNFLEYEDKIATNPFRKMKIQIREPKILPNVMNIHEVEKIIKSTYKTKQDEKRINSYAYAESIRNIAVIELLFASGVRVSELSNLKEGLIDLNSGQMKVKGKGDKERIIQICNKETLRSLKEYHKLFLSKIKGTSGYFFINRFNKRFSEQSIRFLVKKHARMAGLDRKITPHAFRHSFATLLLEEDVDIKYIQHLLGHSSIMTTQIYTHVNGEKQKKILSQRHPRKHFRIKSEAVIV